MAQNVADQFVATLAAAGVKRIYGIVGDSLNGVTDALRRQGKIEWIHVRHEEVAAFAAGAEAHLTGELAVCAGSCGPGNLHLINGLFDCHRSRVPVLAIAAQIPSAEIGSRLFPGNPPADICSANAAIIASWSPTRARCRACSRSRSARRVGKRGVSVVVIPGDVALAGRRDAAGAIAQRPAAAAPVVAAGCERSRRARRAARTTRRGDPALRRRLRRRARPSCSRLAELLKAPIVHALRGKEHVEWDNPFDVGMTGLIGFSSGYYAMEDCDTLLMLGTDFPYRQFYPEKAKIAQVDVRPEQIWPPHARSTSAWSATSARRIDALLAAARREDATTAHPRRARASIIARPARSSTSSPPAGRPQTDPSAAGGARSSAILPRTTRSSPATSACRRSGPRAILKMNGKRRLIGSFWHGSMANAMAQAIGAQAAFPEPAGHLAVGRRRIHHADGRLSQPHAARPAGEGRRLQQRRARLRRAGAEVHRLPRLWHRAQEPELRRHGRSRRASAASGSRIRPSVEDAIADALAHDGPVLVDAVVNRPGTRRCRPRSPPRWPRASASSC